ncbi:hypothetical protein B9Z55_002686 [Caenorhabditis nigoni]|uniref:UBA domain-containing protein n=1 Tax=Caenorhabditis nigoni TaxID=1611254 RepID=A0A2G5VLN7_9PELO|nr:hypothetical protein B9Z55_002686 [Caenorhabditis nigoni]
MEGVQKKLDVEMEVSETLDLSAFRGHGKREDEELLPKDTVPPADAPPEIPANVRAVAGELMIMGFQENQSIRAAYFSNGNAEVATNWLMEHLEEPDINAPFVMPTGTPSARGEIDPNLVDSIVEMGFSRHHATYALKQVPTVAELFTNLDSIPEESAATTGTSSDAPEASVTELASKKSFKDGSEKYQLIGIITHMGSRPDSGHYVAHMLKDGKWVLFNDEKVALSQDSPIELAYIYLYKRVD